MTLLELLVVIAIIALLAALLLTAVQVVRQRAQELACYNDLVGLHVAIAAFITGERSPGFLPSEFDPSGGDPASRDIIVKMFGPQTGGKLFLPSARLQGDEALVLLLGGPGGKGWSANPLDPTDPTGPRRWFYQFPQSRLVDPDGNGYPSYLDTFGNPIAYFCPRHWNGAGWTSNDYRDDCPRLGVKPYLNEAQTSWQLISSGQNRRFGLAGAVWTAASAATVYPPATDGHDDMANFAPGIRLGVVRR
jgi:type II secretory pathway pseudopilin PulG